MNFYKHHLGDYAKDTAHLSILEHGVYLLMLHHHYATEAPLPADQAVICRIIRAINRTEIAAVAEILRQFWTLTPAGWVNGRATKEIERAASQRDTNRELGKRGGRPRRTESVSESETESVYESEPNGKPNRNPSQTPDSRQRKNQVTVSGEGGGTGEGVPASPSAPPPAPSRLGTRLDPDWVLPPAWRDWARQQRPDLDLTTVTDRFRDHWLAKPGKDGRKADWEATWRNWIRRENGNGAHRETAADRHRNARSILDAAIAECPEIVGTGVLRTHEDAVSRILDGEVVDAGRLRAAPG